MKNWTLESPAVGLLLHLGLFALVSAALLYSEHHAAPAPPATAATAAPIRNAPPPAQQPDTTRVDTAARPAPHPIR